MVKRLVWIIILGGFLIYAIPQLLYRLSILIDRNGKDEESEQTQNVLFPPILEGLPEATNSATLTVKGFAQNTDKVELFINDISKDTVAVGTKEGNFQFTDVALYEGNNLISVVGSGSGGVKSIPSEPMTVYYKKDAPKLVLESPEDQAQLSGDKRLELRGLTDPENTLTVNGRWTRVLTDGTFKTYLDLNEGENTIEVVTKDRAGNESKITRFVTYTK